MKELTRALERFLEAKTEYDKAFNDCEGTWGYYGQYYEEQLEKAEKAFSDAFVSAVESVIERGQK